MRHGFAARARRLRGPGRRRRAHGRPDRATQLAGIRPAAPGYRTILIAPQIPPGLRRVAAGQDTVRGKITSEWTRTNRSLTLSVRIPPNATATVRVRLLGATAVTAPPGARLIRKDAEQAVYAVTSGSWTFRT